jgi:hypothetical protein
MSPTFVERYPGDIGKCTPCDSAELAGQMGFFPHKAASLFGGYRLDLKHAGQELLGRIKSVISLAIHR